MLDFGTKILHKKGEIKNPENVFLTNTQFEIRFAKKL